MNKLSQTLKTYFENNFVSTTNEKSILHQNLHIWKEELNQQAVSNNFSFLEACFPRLKLFSKKQEINVSFTLYNSFIGEVPVITIDNEDTFNTFLTLLIYNDPLKDIPKSLGAMLVNGILNHKKSTLKNHINLVPSKDSIIILSTKNYSNIPASSLMLDETEWREISHKIRLEHECVHFYTLKKYGIASNNLHDELIADYVGIIKSTGKFNENWILNFMGLQEFPLYKKGSRLENYTKNISDFEFKTILHIVYQAIANITYFDSKIGPLQSNDDLRDRIDTLCSLSLLEISSVKGGDLLVEIFKLKRIL